MFPVVRQKSRMTSELLPTECTCFSQIAYFLCKNVQKAFIFDLNKPNGLIFKALKVDVSDLNKQYLQKVERELSVYGTEIVKKEINLLILMK